MRGYRACFAAVAMLLVPLAAAGLASAAGEDLTAVLIEQGSTTRFGGGDWVSVKSGDARVAVLYGTSEHPNRVVVFAEYKRFLGGADIYDDQGNLLGTRSIPVFTVFGQALDGLIEFQDNNGDRLLNFRAVDRTELNDTPVKAIGFGHLGWTLSGLTQTNASGTRYVNFTVGAENVPYDRVWESRLARPGTPADGSVGRIAFTFHLRVDIREITAEVPWFRVTVSTGTPRNTTAVERLDNRTLTGSAVAMGAKYDHEIDGWDFADLRNKLALESRVFYGNYIPERVVDFVHRAFFHGEASSDGGFRRNGTVTTEERPTLVTKDYVYFDDAWERIGRFVWVSDVVVDGVRKVLVFQVQGGAREALSGHNGAMFIGFHLRGAFIYPAGQSIVHDPAIEATSASYAIPTVVNLTPFSVLALQLVIAAVALGPAVWVRTKGRVQK